MEELIKTICYCKCHDPVAVHKHYKIYIHGIENGYTYISQIYGDSKVLFVKSKITFGKMMVVRLKDNDGTLRTVAICKDDFFPIGIQAKRQRIPVSEIVY